LDLSCNQNDGVGRRDFTSALYNLSSDIYIMTKEIGPVEVEHSVVQSDVDRTAKVLAMIELFPSLRQLLCCRHRSNRIRKC